jgi:phosphonate transport system substrate-binding protein
MIRGDSVVSGVAGGTIRFGISRSHGGDRILDGARRFTEVISELVNEKVRLHVAFDYNDLLRAFLAGGVEIAWLSPLVLVRAMMKAAHLAAVCERGGELTYRSALLVRDDSTYAAIEDLSGARAVWGDPSSASGHVFPRLHLSKRAVTLGSERFAGSFAQACAQVQRGEADVCAIFMHGETPPASLRVLELSGPIPPDGFVIGPQLGAAEQTRLTTALHGLHALDEGKVALRLLVQAQRLVAPTDEVQRAIGSLVSILTSARPEV